jgi:chaperone required for assembly of F1-ATPase
MSAESNAAPRRFYAAVAVDERAGGFVVLLDERLLKTPGARTVFAPTRALAELIAAEWAAQGERIDYQAMPATRLMGAALDRGAAERRRLCDDVIRHLETDIVCHLAENDPELAAREDAVWAPLRAWAGETMGVVLTPAAGVKATPQPDASLEAAYARVSRLDDVTLVAVAVASMILGSTVLALALLERRLDAAAAFAASRVEETYQAERWGLDAEAAARATRLGEELATLERIIRAAAQPAH